MAGRRRQRFRGGERYRRPQAWIDHVVATDLALKNVRLSAQPRYSGRLRYFGWAKPPEPGILAGITIGRKSLVSRLELVDTIIHEELHHRLYGRACLGSRTALRRIADLELEEDYVIRAAARFLRFQGQ